MALELKGRIKRERTDGPAATACSLLQNGKISQRKEEERDREQRDS